jgi:twitching motility protein PilT
MKTIKIEGEVLTRVLSAMKQSDMLGDLSDKSLSQIAGRAQLIQFDPDEIVVSENDPSDSFFLMISGEVAILYTHESSDETVELGRIRPFRAIGEISLLLNEPRTATVQAAETTLMLKFDSSLFNYMFEHIPTFGPTISRNLALRVKQLSSHMPLPRLPKDAAHPDRDVVLMLPIEFIIRHRVMPVRVEGNIIRIGFVNDPNTNTIGAVRRFLPSMELRMVRIDNDYFDDVVKSISGVDGWEKPEEAPGAEVTEEASKSPKLDQLLKRVVGEGASDLHLSAKHPPYWRVDGDLKAIEDMGDLAAEEVLDLLTPVMDSRIRAGFLENNDVDFIYPVPGLARFRVNMFRDDNGVGAVLRFIPSKILSFEQLALPKVLQKLCDQPKGLVLVTGPTGSGKSTTLAAMIDYINQNRHEHIVTMEDPIEFAHTSAQSLINQREIGRHAKSYARALRAALREDPDIVLVGEMRDLETISLALETANTGHLVFATLHTSTAISTMTRVIDAFPPDQQDQVRVSLADSLKGVVSQALCKGRDSGRIAAIEVLIVNLAISNLIREQKYNQIASMMQTGKAQGNILLNEALEKLVRRKKIHYKEAMSKSVDKQDLTRRLENLYGPPKE